MKPLINGLERFRNSLRFRLIVGSVLVEVVMLAVMIGNTLRQADLHMGELTRARSKEMAETFSVALAPPLAAQDLASLRSLVDRLASLPDVTYLTVTDRQGRPLSAAGHQPEILPEPDQEPKSDAGQLHARADLELFGQIYGRVNFGLSLEALRRAEDSLLRQGLAIAVAEILLSVLALFSITLILTQRLDLLTRASVRLAAGDYEAVVGSKGNDEVAMLSAAFNAMSQAVREQFRRLDDNAVVLRRSNAELSRMAEVMAHHLQEPLRRVVSYAQLLERRLGERQEPDVRDCLGFIVDGALRMRRLLSDLQAYLAVDIDPRAHGRMVNLEQCAQQAVAKLMPVCNKMGGWVDVGPLPSMVGNGNQLRAVFQHLIENALEHAGPDERPLIRISATRADGHHVVSVSDNGPGIPAEYHKRVFSLFERLEADTQGTGVGLAMVRKIVESHGGTAWAEDNHPTGLTICFSLPMDVIDEPRVGGASRGANRGPETDQELQRMAARMARSEERYRLLLKTASDGIHVLDSHGNLLEASDSFREMLGYSQEETLPHNAADWDAQFSAEDLADHLLPQMLNGPLVFQTRHRRRDGGFIDVEINSRPVEVDGILYIYGSSRSITERKRAEAELRAANARLRLVLETAAEGIFGLDDESRISFANPAAASLLGWPSPNAFSARKSSEAIGHFLADGHGCEHGVCSIRQTLEDGKIRRVSNEWFSGSSGHRIPVEYVVAPVMVDDIPVGAVVVFRDINDRHALEDDLRRAELLLRSAIDTIDEAFVIYDADDRLFMCNERYRATYAASAPALEVGNTFEAILRYGLEHRQYIQAIGREEEWLAERLAQHRRADTNVIQPLSDGRWLRIIERRTPEEFIVGFRVDVTDLIKAQKDAEKAATAIKESEENFRLMFIDAPDAYLILDMETGCFCACNHATERMLRGRRDQIEGLPPDALSPPYQPDGRTSTEAAAEKITTAIEVGFNRFEWLHRRLDGKDFWAEVMVTIGTYRQRQALYVTWREIDDIVAARQALDEANTALMRSNAELEHFAYAASHDLRQPLRMVSSYLSLLSKRMAGRLSEDESQFIGFAVDGAQRMDHMITDLLNYSRIGRNMPKPDEVPLEQPLKQAIDNLEMAIRDTEATILYPETLPTISGHESQLERLFQNLISNALKFIPPGRPPRITIECHERTMEWIVAVSDNGIGIAAKSIDRLFTVFQRLVSHDQYQGTGIGLASCRKIVEHHGGRIWVESEEGVGSTFLFALPKANKSLLH
ncbi:hypothetical protein CU669_20475 [Paramagnetospirillum kuznetsovii]|uniref:histidine kinase n=1 Tax=Paramagnetospirillum kuznetsovii TaxID=2053833 RepID=A0A364NSL6_9PROT|nr:ATP-binding protein [Paramagnetospirillum kuznetsovii]RAU20054.1 hypothetical protein CU669_20475 [Paramagnetospirillum kuznetsovii]